MKSISNISQCTHIYLPYRCIPFRPFHFTSMPRKIIECAQCKCESAACAQLSNFHRFQNRHTHKTCISKWNISMRKVFYLSPYFRVDFFHLSLSYSLTVSLFHFHSISLVALFCYLTSLRAVVLLFSLNAFAHDGFYRMHRIDRKMKCSLYDAAQ